MSILLWTRASLILYLILSFTEIQEEHFYIESKVAENENDVAHNEERGLCEFDCHKTTRMKEREKQWIKSIRVLGKKRKQVRGLILFANRGEGYCQHVLNGHVTEKNNAVSINKVRIVC